LINSTLPQCVHGTRISINMNLLVQRLACLKRCLDECCVEIRSQAGSPAWSWTDRQIIAVKSVRDVFGGNVFALRVLSGKGLVALDAWRDGARSPVHSLGEICANLNTD
jgi:hypothetical protein